MQILGFTIYSCIIVISSYLVGIVLPKKYSSINNKNILSLNLIYGICINHCFLLFLMALRININFIAISFIILNLFCLIYLLSSSNNFLKKEKNFIQKPEFNLLILKKLNFFKRKNFLIFLFYLLLCSIPFLYLIKNESIYFLNLGPDYEGHLWSSISLLLNKTIKPLYDNLYYLTGSYDQWALSNTWSASSFLDAVGIEFLLRTLRSYHAIIPSILSIIIPYDFFSSLPNNLPLQALQSFSVCLTSLLVYELSLSFGLPKKLSFLLGSSIAVSNTFIFMNYEGITGQLLSTPFYSFLFIFSILSFNRIKNSNIEYSPILFALVGVTSITAQGEGMQILLAFLLILLFLSLLTNFKNNLRKIKNKEYYVFPSFFYKKNFISLLIFTPVFIVFLQWSWFRYIQGFSGGALHFNWNPLAIAAGLPSVSEILTGIYKPEFSISDYPSLITIITFFSLIIAFIIRKNIFYLSTTSFILLLFIVSKTGHLYAGFKVAALIYPVFLLTTLLSFRNIISKKSIKIILYIVCLSVLFLNLNFNFGLLKGYNSKNIFVRDKDYIQICKECSKSKPQLFIFDKDTGENARHIILTKNYINGSSAWGPTLPRGLERIDVIRVKDNNDNGKNTYNIHKFNCKYSDIADKNGKFKKNLQEAYQSIDPLNSMCKYKGISIYHK